MTAHLAEISNQSVLSSDIRGCFDNIEDLHAAVQGFNGDFSDISNVLCAQKIHFGVIIETEDFVFAAVDHTRSYPVFYTPDNKGSVSYKVQDVLSENERGDVDQQALLEFCMSGYVLGDRTLYPQLRSLQGGECLIRNKKTGQVTTHRYYQYAPHPQNKDTKDQALTALGKALDSAILRMMEKANGATIWVPLSGGLDSRLIAAKLHEHGYDNFHLFSYGLAHNDEAQIAKKVAQKLEKPWRMLKAQPRKAAALYQRDLCRDYEELSHGFCAIPSYVEFEVIYLLKKSGLAQEGDFIVNGQTGDFISGGHVPEILYENENPTLRDLTDFAITKHFSMWNNLKSPQNLESLSASIQEHLIQPIPDLSEKENLIRQYESFEWAERQCKMVVHGQRVYDYFGLNWFLPLWDRDLVDFYQTQSFAHKYKQSLWEEYLKAYNYKGVFDVPRAITHTWNAPRRYGIIVWGKMLQIFAGPDAKQDFYKKMSYWNNAHNQYALWGKDRYMRHYKNIRNCISLSLLDYCKRYKIKFPLSDHD